MDLFLKKTVQYLILQTLLGMGLCAIEVLPQDNKGVAKVLHKTVGVFHSNTEKLPYRAL